MVVVGLGKHALIFSAPQFLEVANVGHAIILFGEFININLIALNACNIKQNKNMCIKFDPLERESLGFL